MEKSKPAPFLVLAAEYAGLWAMEKLRAFGELVDDAMDIDFGDLED